MNKELRTLQEMSEDTECPICGSATLKRNVDEFFSTFKSSLMVEKLREALLGFKNSASQDDFERAAEQADQVLKECE